MLAIIFLVGLIVLIIWLVVKPKHLVYSIESGSIVGYNLAETNHLNSTFKFVIKAYNPNKKVSIYYDKVETWVSYDKQKIAFNTLAPFFQPRKNVTMLGVNLVAHDVALSGDTAADLKRERSGGTVVLDFRMRAKIRVKVGGWKSRHRTLRVKCSPVLVRYKSTRAFHRKSCDVDM